MNTRGRRLANKNSAARLLVMCWISVAAAAFIGHSLSFVLLLIAATLMLAAVGEMIGFGADGAWSRTLARRGAVHFVLQVFCSVAVVAVIAVPLIWLARGGALPAALMSSAACLIALLGISRIWPALALPFIWDDAFPREPLGSWIWHATTRSMRFASHLSRRNDRFFSHALPASLGQLCLIVAALTLATVAQDWPLTWRLGAFAVHGLIILPAAQLTLLNRCLRLMLADRHGARHRRRLREPQAAEPRSKKLAPLPLLELVAAGNSCDAIAALQQPHHHKIEDLALAARLACDQGDVRLLRELLRVGASLHDKQAGSPLLAVLRTARDDASQAELVMTLLANGADVRSIDDDGSSVLHLAAEHGGGAVAALLLDGGADLEACDIHGHTPLARACARGSWSFAQELINAGAATQPQGMPPLLLAADPRSDDAAGVHILRKRRVPLDTRGPLGRTPLLVAVLAGRIRIATALLEAGADVNLADERGTTALMEAARTGNFAMIELLSVYEPKIDVRDRLGRTALAIACIARHGSREVVQRLLAVGADPDMVDNVGKRPADHVAASGRWHLLQALDSVDLVPAAAIKNSPPRHGNADHLLDALRFGHWNLVDLYHADVPTWPASALAGIYRELNECSHQRARDWLLNHGLTVDSVLPDGEQLANALVDELPTSAPALLHLLCRGGTLNGSGIVARTLAAISPSDRRDHAPLLSLVESVICRGGDVFGVDVQGESSLHHVVRSGRDDILQQLLVMGVDPNLRSARGVTAIQIALQVDADVALRMVPILLRHGACPRMSAESGESALGMALAGGNQRLVWWLQWGVWNLPGRRLRADDLCAAAAVGDAAAVERLLALGLHVDEVDSRGASALLHAVGMGHGDVVALLLSRDAQPLQVAESGASCLSVAIHAGHQDLLVMLLEHGVDVNHRIDGGPTALMVAAALGAVPMVALLLDKGADVNLRDSGGMSALLGAACYAFPSSDAEHANRLLGHLLGAGADLSAQNEDGQNALCLLLGAGAPPGTDCNATALAQMLSFMLARGAPLSAADQRGVSALHACAMHGLLGCAHLLVDAGADIAAVDMMGRTPADVATLLGYVDVAAELRGGYAAIPGARRTLRHPATPD